MSNEALELLERIHNAPESVRREISAELLESELRSAPNNSTFLTRLHEIAGRFNPTAGGDLKPHDQAWAEAIVESKSDSKGE